MMRAIFMAVAMMAAGTAWSAEQAPDFSLRDLQGNTVTLSALKGSPVILSFWATWCGPCKEEMPHLQKMLETHGASGLKVLSVNIDDARRASQVKPYIATKGYTFPVLLDSQSTVIGRFNPSKTLPYTVVLNGDQEIVYIATGYNPGDEVKLEGVVKPLLGAAPAAPAPAPAPAAAPAPQ